VSEPGEIVPTRNIAIDNATILKTVAPMNLIIPDQLTVLELILTSFKII
jgi:hypothetical protein